MWVGKMLKWILGWPYALLTCWRGYRMWREMITMTVHDPFSVSKWDVASRSIAVFDFHMIAPGWQFDSQNWTDTWN